MGEHWRGENAQFGDHDESLKRNSYLRSGCCLNKAPQWFVGRPIIKPLGIDFPRPRMGLWGVGGGFEGPLGLDKKRSARVCYWPP